MKIIKLNDFKFCNRVKRFKVSPNPYFTATSKINVTKLVKLKKHHKFNAMLCYCIQQAGQKIEGCHYDFYDENNIVYYENVYVNWVIVNDKGLHSYVGIPHEDNFEKFEKEYINASNKFKINCQHNFIDNQSLLSTSAVINREFESFSCGYSPDFIKNFIIWGKYERRFRKAFLNISFRFHHSFFDGQNVGNFFNILQNEINNLKI